MVWQFRSILHETFRMKIIIYENENNHYEIIKKYENEIIIYENKNYNVNSL